MNCREFTEFLLSYLDGELPPDQRDVFESHLERCPPCGTYLETYRRAVRLGQNACAEGAAVPSDAPEELIQAILAARRKQGD